MSITYSECVIVALRIQHAMRMRCVILISVASLTLPYFSTLSPKRGDFKRYIILHAMFVLIFSTACV